MILYFIYYNIVSILLSNYISTTIGFFSGEQINLTVDNTKKIVSAREIVT